MNHILPKLILLPDVLAKSHKIEVGTLSPWPIFDWKQPRKKEDLWLGTARGTRGDAAMEATTWTRPARGGQKRKAK